MHLKKKEGTRRSRTTSREQDEKIDQAYENDPLFIPRRPLQLQIFNVSAQTVRRRLREHGLKTRKPTKHRLTKENKEARMTCAVAHHR